MFTNHVALFYVTLLSGYEIFVMFEDTDRNSTNFMELVYIMNIICLTSNCCDCYNIFEEWLEAVSVFCDFVCAFDTCAYSSQMHWRLREVTFMCRNLLYLPTVMLSSFTVTVLFSVRPFNRLYFVYSFCDLLVQIRNNYVIITLLLLL